MLGRRDAGGADDISLRFVISRLRIVEQRLATVPCHKRPIVVTRTFLVRVVARAGKMGLGMVQANGLVTLVEKGSLRNGL
jgi:hypothetical protein